MKYILFDVAGTLLHKPSLYSKIQQILITAGFNITLQEIKHNHKLVSELIVFPDQTNKNFYAHFNTEFLFSLGVVPTEKLLNSIFEECTYLPWEKFEDTFFLNQLTLPIGLLSNFNSSLKNKIESFFGPIFQDIFVSEEMGVAKPAIEFYQRAIEKIGIEPSEILYVGDSMKLDIKPALDLGIKAILVDRDQLYLHMPNRIQSLLELNTFL